MIVRFTKTHNSYNSGELAGFDEKAAADLIARGVAVAVRKPATIDELEAECKAAGYSGKAAKSLAKERFEGKHGEEARYLTPPEEEQSAAGGAPSSADLDQAEAEKETAAETAGEKSGDLALEGEAKGEAK